MLWYDMILIVLCLWALRSEYVGAAVCFRSVWRGNADSSDNPDRQAINCQGPFTINKTEDECCNHGGMFYTNRAYSSAEFFRYRIIGKEIPGCTACSSRNTQIKNVTSCQVVDCGADPLCIARRQNGACVCRRSRPRCKTFVMHAVCGTNGKTYRNACILQRHACHRQNGVTMAYNGTCRDNCVDVTCPGGQSCVVDQYNKSHCVSHCSNLCVSSNADTMVCGANGVTYRSHCELRVATCKLGKTIGIAYLGQCKVGSNCSTITCSGTKKCLTDHHGNPRCTSCRALYCRGLDNMTQAASVDAGQDPAGYKTRDDVLCGMDGNTYRSYCELRRHSCKIGRYINIKHKGPCKGQNLSGSALKLTLPTLTIGSGKNSQSVLQQSDGRSPEVQQSSVVNFLKTASFDKATLRKALTSLGYVKMTPDKKTQISLKTLICLMYPRNATKILNC